ncbi:MULTISPECIES: glycine cleavage system aminomethyltransferase GcvT [unclassified Corynebacterium]|uniref:glycine cleavage system aminomethyltransferase GcvT n=1 Tax=unclassified Corynebacterium TaxID=2624378 RepID=UPI001EF5DFC8|nr:MULTISPECIES: glycine cleavage system aminomethyltransferase GcvT [unclassified Corynebacterium]MCG7290370.1 glycine cleavage system aminomethyltransferase GcvT [Corynebacterium sp. ACRPZ]MCG7294605.1 glycine cleavage system aminomethyltransferase GcvT [Corynebacterium sp. ACRPY]MDL0402955.1 glycine cleavage system aminomethyltransferase GcvT [Corynebacterium lehmanniae]
MPQTPLHATHEKLGASFTDFGGWEMPLKYGSELEEHRAVRNDVGIFDLSHMGEITVQGPDAAAFLDYTLISNFSALKEGKAKYSMIVAEDGGILDDLITYKFSENHFMVVPNAANTNAVWAAFEARKGDFDVELSNNSEAFALVAVQGPRALEVLEPLLSDDASALSYYSGAWMTLDGVEIFVARTGYTGEDGFELFCTSEDAQKVWDAVIGSGTPCGLAARDSLRLEASMPLYGHELTAEITPVEAGMGRAFAKKEADFVGKDALTGREPSVVIAGLTSEQRRAAREGAEVFLAGSDEKIGVVTSGQPSPTLGYPVALAHLDPKHAEEGTEVEIDIRGRRYPFTIAPTPFYSRKDA